MSIIYNNKQGMIVRLCTFVSTALLALFGVYRFYYHSFFATTPIEKMSEFWRWIHPQFSTPGKPWPTFTIPAVLIEIPLSPRFCIAIGFVILALVLLAYFCFRHQRVSNFLIDTESEMRKVSWPTVNEVGASSLVVIIVIVILGIYLFFVDKGLVAAFNWIFFEKS